MSRIWVPVARISFSMHTHLTEVLSRLDGARAALRGALDAIPAPLQRQRPAPDRWSAAEVLEHLTLVERIFGGRIVNAIDAARSGLAPEAQPRTALPDAIEQRMSDRVNKRQAPEPRSRPARSMSRRDGPRSRDNHATLRAALSRMRRPGPESGDARSSLLRDDDRVSVGGADGRPRGTAHGADQGNWLATRHDLVRSKDSTNNP